MDGDDEGNNERADDGITIRGEIGKSGRRHYWIKMTGISKTVSLFTIV
jgi:hypothetical protein